MRDDGDVVRRCHAARVRQQSCGMTETEDKTHEATLMSSVRPPSHMTSGWMMASDRFSISFRKPYLRASACGAGAERGELGERYAVVG